MGEHLAADIGALLAGVLLAGLFVFVVLMGRRWLLERAGGTVECALRTAASRGGSARGTNTDAVPDTGAGAGSGGDADGDAAARARSRGDSHADFPAEADDASGPGAWRLGIARYSRDDLCWYRLFSFSFNPMIVLRRRGLVVVDRREPTVDEVATLTPDVTVVTLRDGDQEVEVALSPAALVGFLAWLEAAPPGFSVNYL